MKKITAMSFAAAFALSAFAAPEEAAMVRVADSAGLTAAAMKLGELTGNPMVGAMLAAKVQEIPLFKSFGPTRPGASIGAVVFADAEAMSSALASGKDVPSPDFAILYPVESKDAFLARQKGSEKKDGLYFVKDAELGVKCDMYFDFSPDGKWVVACDKAEFVKKALASVTKCEKSMGTTVLSACVGEKGVNVVYAALGSAIADLAKFGGSACMDMVKKELESAKDFFGFSLKLCIDDKGVGISSKSTTKKGTESAKMYATPLPPNPLAFADETAFVASAFAENAGGGAGGIAADIVLDSYAKAGIKGLTATKVSDGERFLEFDIPAFAAAMFEGLGDGAKKDPIDVEKLQKEYAAGLEAAKDQFEAAKNKAFRSSFTFKGAKSAVTPAQRFASILPEAAGKPVSAVSACGVYGATLAVATQVLDNIPLPDAKEMTEQLKPLLGMFPKDTAGGLAYATWREGDDVKTLFRISADELRNFGTAVNAAIGFYMSQAGKAGSAGDED